MKIFIGSSKESINLLREIEVWIEENNHIPIPWDQPGIFRPGDSTFDTLIRLSNEVDAAVFIFSEDDKVWYRETHVTQPRDNIILEYGMFLGKIGKSKAIILKNGYPKSASDILGINLIDISNNKKSRGKYEFIHWCNTLEPTKKHNYNISYFIKQRDEVPNFKKIVEKNNEIWIAAKSLTNLLNQYGDFILSEAKKDKKFKFIIHNPNLDYMMLSVTTNSATNVELNRVKSLGFDSISFIKNIIEQAPPGNIELKLANAPLYCGYTIMDANDDKNGLIYQELFGYKLSLSQRLTAIYKNEDSSNLFEYHVNQFKKLWKDANEI